MRKILPALERAIRLLAFTVIGFFLGALFTHSNPSFHMGLSAALGILVPFRDAYKSSWWSPRPPAASGLVRYDRARAYKGLTLYTSGDLQGARLIDMQGRVRHRWHLDGRALDGGFDLADIFGTGRLYWETAHLFPNGDLLAVIVRNWTPYGYRLIKLDKDSRLLWQAPINAHHDISVDAGGRIFTLSQHIRKAPVPGWPQIVTPFLEDTVVRLSPEGKVEKEVSIVEAFARSNYAAFLRLHPVDEIGDILHANRAHVISAEEAAVLPFAEAGQVLISLREIHTIAVLDPASRRITWATRGPWMFQHDPDILANGHFLLFDNWGHVGPGGASRVIEYDPLARAITWSYAGSRDAPLFSDIRSDAQRLPNGDTLIAESDTGRIFEVTRDGEVVWEFVNPARSPDGKLVAALGLDVTRFAEVSLPFLARPGR